MAKIHGFEKRYLEAYITKDLDKKMVFLAGPRQVGKTTLSKKINKNSQYLNYDITSDRTAILKEAFDVNSDLIIFDEIHKYKNWRNYLKGIYDSQDRHHKKILVTGSAKLDVYKRGGDSLQGRYFFYRLHPLSVKELKIRTQSDVEDLLSLGGFPEPFFSASMSEARRWRVDYYSRIIREEVASLEKVDDLGRLELLAHRLPDLVSSPLSINSLREDLVGASHRGVSNWLNIFEKLYMIFRISPFGSPKIKAVKKEQKHYHWDWAVVEDEGARFENFIASHLNKWCDFLKDTEGRIVELRYLRDETGREVDFILVEKSKPLMMIECKYGSNQISPHLKYFKNKFPNVRAVLVCNKVSNEFINKDGIEVLSAGRLLSEFV